MTKVYANYADADEDTYSEEQLEQAIELALAGKNISAIVEALGTDRKTFWYYREYVSATFARELLRALAEGVDTKVDRLDTILEEYPNVNDARLMSDNIKWSASKRKPAVYGDRIDVTVNETVSIRGALEEGRLRAMRDVTPRSLPAERSATGLPPVAGFLSAAERGAPNAGSDGTPECVITALAGPTTRRDGRAATPASPLVAERVTGHRSAKNESVSHADIDIDLDLTNAPVDPLS